MCWASTTPATARAGGSWLLTDDAAIDGPGTVPVPHYLVLRKESAMPISTKRSSAENPRRLIGTARLFFANAIAKSLFGAGVFHSYEEHEDEGLAILGVTREHLTCAYCGDPCTETHPLFAVVEDG